MSLSESMILQVLDCSMHRADNLIKVHSKFQASQLSTQKPALSSSCQTRTVQDLPGVCEPRKSMSEIMRRILDPDHIRWTRDVKCPCSDHGSAPCCSRFAEFEIYALRRQRESRNRHDEALYRERILLSAIVTGNRAMVSLEGRSVCISALIQLLGMNASTG